VYVYPGLIYAKTATRELGEVVPKIDDVDMVDVRTSIDPPNLLAAGAGKVYLKLRKHPEYVVDQAEVLKAASVPTDDATHFYLEIAEVFADYRVTQKLDGNVYAVSGSSDGWWPFKSAVVDVETGECSFHYGTVAGLTSTAVGVSVAGTIPTPGIPRTLTLPEATAGKIWIAMTVSNNATTGELEVSAAALGAGGTLPGDTTTVKHVQVGEYKRPTDEDLADVVMFVETHLYGVRMGAPGGTTHAVVARA
jgi:hypothetical protein